jgi:hypothetical protein
MPLSVVRSFGFSVQCEARHFLWAYSHSLCLHSLHWKYASPIIVHGCLRLCWFVSLFVCFCARTNIYQNSKHLLFSTFSCISCQAGICTCSTWPSWFGNSSPTPMPARRVEGYQIHRPMGRLVFLSKLGWVVTATRWWGGWGTSAETIGFTPIRKIHAQPPLIIIPLNASDW